MASATLLPELLNQTWLMISSVEEQLSIISVGIFLRERSPVQGQHSKDK